jgi:hypothetical protein
MNRYFKIVRADNGIADIVSARDENQAWEIAHYDGRLNFRIAECERAVWWTWTVTNWAAVDALENDMNNFLNYF